MSDKAVITCALTGVLTDPRHHPVPVTPEQMAGFVERADSTKLKRALELLKQVHNGQANVREPQVAGGER